MRWGQSDIIESNTFDSTNLKQTFLLKGSKKIIRVIATEFREKIRMKSSQKYVTP